jgi:hypothetical protein
MRFGHLTTGAIARWTFRTYVMRFAHLAAVGPGRWEFRIYVMRFYLIPGRPVTKWQNRMLYGTRLPHPLPLTFAERSYARTRGLPGVPPSRIRGRA